MATTLWNNLDGNWNTDANWSGVHPADGDTAIFRSGSQSVTTIPATADESITMYVEKSFSGNFGSSGNEMDFRFNKLVHEGTGTVWLNSNAGTAEFSDVLIINSTNMTNAATLGGDEVARVIVRSGKVTIAGGLVHDFELYVVGPNAHVVVEAGAGGTTASALAAVELRLVQTAGVVESNIAWDSAFISGGTFTHENSAINALTCQGGNVSLNHRAVGSDQITNDLSVVGGTVDLTQINTGTFAIGGDLVVAGTGTLKYNQGEIAVGGFTAIAGGNYIAV